MQFYINISGFSCLFVCFLNRFTCAHNSKMWNKTRMKKTGENILKRAGHEQHTSDPRGTGWGINPMEKAAADLLKKQK